MVLKVDGGLSTQSNEGGEIWRFCKFERLVGVLCVRTYWDAVAPSM